jgi:hypothetical protein
MTCFLSTSIDTDCSRLRVATMRRPLDYISWMRQRQLQHSAHPHVVALPWNPSGQISPSSCRYSGTEGYEFTSLIGPFRFGHGVGAYSSPLKSRQPSPLHTLPHHSCSTTPPRSCLAMHARTGAWALIVEPSHKSHRHPCLQGLKVSFSYRFTSARDLREPWPRS